MDKSVLIALILVAMPAHAGMYKCTTPEGRVSYQEAPCAGGTAAVKVDIEAPPAISPADQNQAQSAKLKAQQVRLSDAVRAKINAGDLIGARALATTPEDFALVRAAEERQSKKAAKCAAKAADLDRIRQDAADHPRTAWWQNRADEAAKKYANECP